jgi:hypothetical protein
VPVPTSPHVCPRGARRGANVARASYRAGKPWISYFFEIVSPKSAPTRRGGRGGGVWGEAIFPW